MNTWLARGLRRLVCSAFVLGAIVSVGMAGPYRDAVVLDTPIAYWTFDETDLNDPAAPLGLLEGTGDADGTYTADGLELGQSTLVMGEPDSSLRLFDNGRMTTEPFEKFDDILGIGGTGFTVEFWTSLASAPTGFTNFVGDGEAGGDFNLMVYTGVGSFVRPHNFTVDGLAAIDSVRTLVPEEIVHVVSTWDSDSGETILYLDGMEADISGGFGPNPNFGPAVNTDNQIYIGQDDREPRTPNGWIDEVAIYNYPLEPNRVQAHFDAGQGAEPPEIPAGPPPPPRVNISLSSDVAGKGVYVNGESLGDGMVDIIRQIPNSTAENVVPYTSDDAGPTVDVAPWIADGGTAGGFGSNQHGRGGNLWINGDGEADVPHDGFGGHANWLITFDLEEVRKQRMGDANGELRLTGNYGSWGSIGDTSDPAGVTQGLVFVDGVRADGLAETTHNIPTPGGADSPSQPFDITVPADARYLSLALMSGPDSTFWDDGIFRNVRLRVADPVLDSQDGLVSYWNFDEANEDDVVQDQPGGNFGQFEATAERTDGLIGSGAALFNNSGGDAVNVGTGIEDSFSFTDAISIEAIFQSEWNGSDYDEIFRKEDGGNRLLLSFQNDANNGGANPPVEPGPVLSFGLNVDGYGELDLPLDGLDGRPDVDDLTDGETHHVVATFDSDSGEKAIWIDGEMAWSVDLGAGSQIVSGGGTPAVIGNAALNGGEPFTGVIDEVALWSRALGPDEIAAHFANVLAGNTYFGSGTDPCDFDGDGSLGEGDINILSAAIAGGDMDSKFDVNADGVVNASDLNFFVTDESKLHTWIGDANLDGEFNSSDLVAVFTAGKYNVDAEASWSEGDWKPDLRFDSGDLVAAFTDGGYELGPKWVDGAAAVPEPSSVALLGLGFLGLLGVLRRNR